MSIKAAPWVRTVRRINRADSKVREGDKEVKAKVEDEEKEKGTEFQREENVNRRKIQIGNIGDKNMITERENEGKIPIPEGAIVRKIGTGEQKAKKQEIKTQYMTNVQKGKTQNISKIQEIKMQNITKRKEEKIESITETQVVKTKNINKTQEGNKHNMAKKKK